MSDLTAFRDHCRRMVTADHAPDCPAAQPDRRTLDRYAPAPAPCDGCLTPAQRALFAQLADQVDAYLAGDLTEHLAPTTADQPLDLEDTTP